MIVNRANVSAMPSADGFPSRISFDQSAQCCTRLGLTPPETDAFPEPPCHRIASSGGQAIRSSDALFYNSPSIAKRSDHRNLRCAPQLGQEPSRLQLNAKS